MRPTAAGRRPATAILSLLAILFPLAALAAPPVPASRRALRPAGETGTAVVPPQLLRRWDPVTVFFTRDAGPAAGGPEDRPERLVTMTPAQPGAFTWLDARTLQFRPAEPWPALSRVSIRVKEPDGRDRHVTLSTLMAAPLKSSPADGTTSLAPFDEITLTFPEPLEESALARMVSIELRPLPGVGGGRARVLSRTDVSVKSIERRSRSDGAAYTLALGKPVPLGTRVLVHLRLSLDDRDAASFKDLSFATDEPFRVLSAGCAERQLPLTPEGTRYGREQAIRCGPTPSVTVELSAAPGELGPVEARNLLRFSPSVEGLTFRVNGRTVEATGRFERERLYAVSVVPAAVVDASGRRLEITGASELFLHFPKLPSYLRFGASHGVVERFGPKMVPLLGRGQERVDLRVHAVDPLDRSLWPFPSGRTVDVNESERPPGPGEEPPPYTQPDRVISPNELVAQIQALPSPGFSALVPLAQRRDSGAAAFGLDLAGPLAHVSGKESPGAYLVGIRALDGGTLRSWMRLQVTDLTLTAVEEPWAVRFVVSSLSTGQPVAGARVRVEGSEQTQRGTTWQTFADGLTGADGSFRWEVPGANPNAWRTVRRLVVEKAGDVLVLDPSLPPDGYADNQWSPGRGTWLDWVFAPLAGRGPHSETLTHLFTDRPVYRPEEEVHIKGFLRTRERGTLVPFVPPPNATVVVEGPGNLAFRYPVAVSASGAFYARFAEKSLPTGEFRARLVDGKERSYGSVSFLMEAYRIPDFQVELHAPDLVPLDRPMEVGLTATYYAGGKVSGQGVQWRVTQFPYEQVPRSLPGFLFSSDGRYSRTQRFQSTPRLEREDQTGEDGSVTLKLDPSLEPTSQPRTYVVEATVTGADDQTVTATRRIVALPPFVVGLSAPRYLERAKEITPRLVVVGHDGKPVAGKSVTVRLLHRQWHSVLRASDFSDGVARYLTDVVDEKVQELTVTSAAEPLTLKLPIGKAGVWIVEASAQDRLGRAQVVAVDLYAGGDEPVTWQRPATNVFSVATDRKAYDPGTTASVVLKSPFQSARALAIVEAPEGNQYRWVDVTGGAATFQLPILKTYVPRVPVHFVLERGRLAGTSPTPGSAADLGKPATLAATAWLDVNPVDNRVDVKLAHPETARPGQRIDVTVKLLDPKGRPLAGEVTLWLVDQAVLALGKEQRLDPLPDFITPVRSHLLVRDTRNGVFGLLAYEESPGGDEGAEGGLLDRTTVRKTFKSVPFYEPSLAVGADGTATVSVELPDNLTNFKLRAKAISGGDRFGFGTGHLAVRLPVLVQPALPRFVRPGDRFRGAALARVVEGKGGPAVAEVRVDGVTLEGPRKRDLTLDLGRPQRLELDVEVLTPAYQEDGSLARESVTFQVGVERTADRASDAFEVKLPIKDDRERVTKRQILELSPGTPVELAALPEAPRAGTLRRTLLVSDQPALIRMAAGLDFLLEYPYGCTEQRASKARAYLALRKFRQMLAQKGEKSVGGQTEVDRAVRGTLEWIGNTVDGNGLVAYWPGSPGYVSLTAWCVELLVEAKAAGFPVDQALLDRLLGSLEKALRSDYSRFIDGESWSERVFALRALAGAGRFDAAYAAELARKPQFLRLEGQAGVVHAFSRTKDRDSAVVAALSRGLWDGLVIRLHQGQEAYGGLQENAWGGSGLILPSETRTVSGVLRAVSRTTPKAPRIQLLVDALVTLGQGDGWGTTNANAEALLALSEVLQAPYAGSSTRSVSVTPAGGTGRAVTISPQRPVGVLTLTKEIGAIGVAADQAPGGKGGRVVLKAETTYVPEADGSQVAASANGFVVSREMRLVVAEGQPPERRPLERAGTTQAFEVGAVVEEHVQVVNPKTRHYVAVVIPLAAGMEPLNPALATAPPEARTLGKLTLAPTYVQMLDDQVAYYYDTLPAGTYDFYARTRATTAGSFVQPPAKAEMMYDGATRGTSNGARVEIDAARPSGAR